VHTGGAKSTDLADRGRREEVLQVKAATVVIVIVRYRLLQRVNPQRGAFVAECRHRQRLRLAAGEQRAAVGAGEDACARNRTHQPSNLINPLPKQSCTLTT
jgi:hypothetical protein